MRIILWISSTEIEVPTSACPDMRTQQHPGSVGEWSKPTVGARAGVPGKLSSSHGEVIQFTYRLPAPQIVCNLLGRFL